ncbi:MAG: DNA polymerase III subunit epsilon [Oligoflexales bacterium]|nr:DNA polymerase III subunit epsilon [Oligoflexales bacterium]
MRQVFGMSEDGNSIILNRFIGELEFSYPGEPKAQATGLFLDVETTGVATQKDKIIDLGYILFSYEKVTGRITGIVKEFSQLQDPGEPLSTIVKQITGYSDADLKGKEINWDEVAADFDKANVIIAHNARFDRGFLDRYLPISSKKVWTCSMAQIDWKEKGHGSRSVEFLAKDHGFFFDGHTALMDVKACVKLLGTEDPESGYPYLLELLGNARIQKKWVYANGAGYDLKDELKQRGYMWERQKKVWKKCVPAESMEEEEFLAQHPLGGEASSEPILLHDLFKSESQSLV